MTTLSINSCHICYYDAFLYACQITCYRDTFVVVVATVLPRYMCYFATPSVTFATPFLFIFYFYTATLSAPSPHCLLPSHIVCYPATVPVTLQHPTRPHHPYLPCHILRCLATSPVALPHSVTSSTSAVTFPHHLLRCRVISYLSLIHISEPTRPP